MKYLMAGILLFFSLHMNAQSEFLVKPYLQIGAHPGSQSLQLLWHTTDTAAAWQVEYKKDKSWAKADNVSKTNINTPGTAPFTIYDASFTGLPSGNSFTYRVTKNGKAVFTADAKAPKTANQSFCFVASGDMGAGTKEAMQVARGIYQSNPDFVAIAGDIVYEHGLISEYKTKFWPIYNAEKDDTVGMPLLRSIPFVAAVGNHDADTRNLDDYPDALAYYLFWDQPLNGPDSKEGGPLVPLLKGADLNTRALKAGAGDKYPRMSNFSFNYGNTHWMVIDANPYVDWTDSAAQAWVRNDLSTATGAIWKFVLFHHPGFNSSIEHYEQQQMRLLSPLFEKGNVDIVFNGHVHNYQRSFPMTFAPVGKGTVLVGGRDGKSIRGRVVNGKWTLDKTFDGKTNTKPHGVIYLISGAGGQDLYNPEQTGDPDSWQRFTDKFVSTIHSFTVVDISGKTLKLKQVDVNGAEVDALQIDK